MEEYIGVVESFGGNFAPRNWMFCNGAILKIAEYQTLFTILGTTYGGDGITTFCLPDLRGRVAINPNTSTPVGVRAGSETVTINSLTFPTHSHVFNGLNGARESPNPANCYLGMAAGNFYCQFDPGDQLLPMNPLAVTVAPGNNQPHNNMSPYLVSNYIICVAGIYPSPS